MAGAPARQMVQRLRLGDDVRNSYVSLGTGGMRRTHLRGHTNILKRLLIHACGFNLRMKQATWRADFFDNPDDCCTVSLSDDLSG